MVKDNKPMNNTENDFVFGMHTVTELLHGDRDVNKIFLQQDLNDRNASTIKKAARQRHVQISTVPKSKLDSLSNSGNHQGVVAAVAAYQYVTVDDLFAAAEAKEEDPFFIVLDGIEDPHNLGSILRTADASGVHGIIIPERRQVGLTQTVAKTSTGAIEHVPVARVTNISRTIDELKERGVWVFGTDMSGDSLWQTDVTLPLAVVIGNEGKGVSPGVKKHLDGQWTIPMRGHVQSLNASVASALLMYEVYRKRMN